MRVKVIGLKRFQGTVDGKSIDSGKLFIEVRLDERRNGTDQFAKGLAVEELRLPGSEMVRRLESLPLPFLAEVSTERVSNGRTASEVVVDVVPVDAAKLKAA
jgi:hypothetical protein